MEGPGNLSKPYCLVSMIPEGHTINGKLLL
jgi:hypothetical protein